MGEVEVLRWKGKGLSLKDLSLFLKKGGELAK